ncbi:MAG: ATP-binding cassette domain-containing protein [Clostridia bacterium]|nr:ATP-binding cassette domain-containing protein [Clostridia bacterium]
MLELKNIGYKINDKVILDNINLKFEAGQIVAITGHNGSGKSTLTKIIMGIVNQTQGNILFNGQNINNLSVTERAKLGIGYTFQQPVKFKGLTVCDLIETATHKPLEIKCGCDYLSRVGLCAKDYLNRELDSNLSGGELKRIELAIALAEGKPLNIFDEPEAGIDIWSFDNLTDLFEDLKSKNNLTIIVTHQQKILDIADQIVVLNSGKLEKVGSAQEILPTLKPQVCAKLEGGNK